MVDSFITFIHANYGFFGIFVLFFALFIFKTEQYERIWPRIRQAAKYIAGASDFDSYELLTSKLKYYTDFKIENIYMKDPGRREIFKDILRIRLKVFTEHLTMMHSTDFMKLSAGEMYGMMVGCIHDSIQEWTSQCKNAGIPDIVLEKYLKFSNKNVEFVLKAMEMVCFSDVYGDNKKRMQVIYSLYTAMFEITMAEAERSLNDINGELDGVTYKGFVCCD